MTQLLLLASLAATGVLMGVASLGVFWVVFAFVAIPMFVRHSRTSLRGTAAPWLGATAALMIASVGLNGIGRAETLAYASLFALYGLWLLWTSGAFDRDAVGGAMKFIIASYFFSVALGTLLLMAGASGLDEFPLARVWVNENSGEVRPMGFSTEPSYAAFIVELCWLALVRLRCISPRGRNGFAIWTTVTLTSLLLLGSIYGYLLFLTIVLTSIGLLPRDTRMRLLLAALLLVGLAYFMLPQEGDSRSLRILHAIATGDLDEWLVEDTSSFFRVGPFFAYMLSANFGDIQTWFGHGATSASFFFVDLFRAHIAKDVDAVELGFIPAYLYDYGLLAAAAFAAFLYRVTAGPHRIAMAMTMLLLVFNANFSTQIIWFAVTCGVLTQSIASPRVPLDEAAQNIR